MLGYLLLALMDFFGTQILSEPQTIVRPNKIDNGFFIFLEKDIFRQLWFY